MNKLIVYLICLGIVFTNYAEIKVEKVIIPAAGFGTRFLPATKVIPKEMIPLAGKPAIQTVVEEALASGIHKIVIIINKRKQAIIDHFDAKKSEPLRTIGKYHMIEENDKKFESVDFSYVNQKIQLGLGHAVLLAESYIENEFFGVILPDEIIFNEDPAFKQLIEVAQRENASVIAVQEVPYDKVSNYGIVKIKDEISKDIYEIDDLIEKPSLDKAPSNLAIIGRYILSPKIFTSLRILLENHVNGELQLTDAIAHMMRESGERVIAYRVQGERHDIGVPFGWIKAIVASSLKDSQYSQSLKEYLVALDLL